MNAVTGNVEVSVSDYATTQDLPNPAVEGNEFSDYDFSHELIVLILCAGEN